MLQMKTQQHIHMLLIITHNINMSQITAQTTHHNATDYNTTH